MSEPTTPLIELWGLDDESLGVIVLGSTGIRWSNQTGGLACLHPEAEGFFVPLPARRDDEKELLLNYGFSDEPYDAARVQAFLDAQRLAEWFEPTPDTQHPLHEAWVPVRVKHMPAEETSRYAGLWSLLADLGGREAIIVYSNSD